MVRDAGTVRSQDLLTSGRRTQIGCYCEDDDASCRRKVSHRSTPGSFSSGRKRARRKMDSFLSDETHVPMILVAPLSPPSPTLSAETQSVIDNVEKMLHEARQQIMEFSRTPSALNPIPVDYPFGPVVDNENDQLLYIRELVTSRLNELDMGTYKSSLKRSRPRHIFRAFPKVDLSAPKFQRRNYQELARPLNHCHAQRSVHYEIPATKPDSLEQNSKRILEKTHGFSVQACPKVNIDRELIAQKMEGVDISPDPSFVGAANIGSYEYRHGSCVGFGDQRRRKVCRIDGGSSNGEAREEGEDVTGVRTIAGTCQVVTNNELEGAASNLIIGAITNSIDEVDKERTGPRAKSEEGVDQRETSSNEEGRGEEGKGGGSFLLGEATEMRRNEKEKSKASFEVCFRCLAKSDSEYKTEENARSKRNDAVRQILDNSVSVEESAITEPRSGRMSEGRKLEREMQREMQRKMQRKIDREIARDHRVKIDRDFRYILKKYDPLYKSDSSNSLEESLNVDSMTNSQILEYDLDDINLMKPRVKHFDAIISIYDETIDKIAQDSEKITAKLSCWRKSYSSGSEDDNSLRSRINFHSTKLSGLESARELTSEISTRDNNTGDGRESVSKVSELRLQPQEAREYNSDLYNIHKIANTEVSRVIGPPTSGENRNERNKIEKESLAKRENSCGDSESVRATPSIGLNRTSDEQLLSVSVERSALESKLTEAQAQRDRSREKNNFGCGNNSDPRLENPSRSARSNRIGTASLSSVASKGNANTPGRSQGMNDRFVSKNDRSAHSPSAHQIVDSARTGREESKNDGERSLPLSSKRVELFSCEIARIKSSQALPPESKVFLTDTLSSADSLKDCSSFRTSVSCPRSQGSQNDNAEGENLIDTKAKATKSIQADFEDIRADAKPVITDVKCVGTETAGEEKTVGVSVQTDAQLAVVESPVPKRANVDVEETPRFLSVNREEDNQSKSSRGSQNSSLEMDASGAISNKFPHSSHKKIRETASDISRSEGEVYYLASSSSYSLGEVRILGKDVLTENGLVIERDGSEGLIAARSTNSTSRSKSSTQSYGEIRG